MTFYNKFYIYLCHFPSGKKIYLDIQRAVFHDAGEGPIREEFQSLDKSQENAKISIFLTHLNQRYFRDGGFSTYVVDWENDRAFIQIIDGHLVMTYGFFVAENDFVYHPVDLTLDFFNSLFNVNEKDIFYEFIDEKRIDIDTEKISNFVPPKFKIFDYVLDELLLKPPSGTFLGGTDYFKVQEKVKEF